MFHKRECTTLEPLLWKYAEDTLDEPERTRVASHLLHCPVCQAHLAVYQATAQGLAGLREQTVPASTSHWSEVHARLVTPQTTPSAPRISLWERGAWGGVALAGMAGLWLCLWVQKADTDKTEVASVGMTRKSMSIPDSKAPEKVAPEPGGFPFKQREPLPSPILVTNTAPPAPTIPFKIWPDTAVFLPHPATPRANIKQLAMDDTSSTHWEEHNLHGRHKPPHSSTPASPAPGDNRRIVAVRLEEPTEFVTPPPVTDDSSRPTRRFVMDSISCEKQTGAENVESGDKETRAW